MKLLSEIIKEQKKKLMITRKDLAKEFGIQINRLMDYENGTYARPIKFNQLFVMSEFFEIPLEILEAAMLYEIKLVKEKRKKLKDNLKEEQAI